MLHTTVADVMATNVVTAPPETSFAHLARLLHTVGVQAVPIVDPAGVLLGVVSEADLMASAARPDTAPGRWQARHLRRDQPEAKAGGTTAAELMTPFVEAVAPTTTVATAASLMVERHLRGLPVCDEAGRVLGVISRSDVLAVFMRDDGAIGVEIVDKVLGPVSEPDAKSVQVDVRDGVVTLTGEVPTREEADRFVHVTERVEGVVAVVDHLTEQADDNLADAHATVRTTPPPRPDPVRAAQGRTLPQRRQEPRTPRASIGHCHLHSVALTSDEADRQR